MTPHTQKTLTHMPPPDDALPPSLRPCDVQALKACLERTGGDNAKCAAEIAAFQRACGGVAAPAPQAATQAADQAGACSSHK